MRSLARGLADLLDVGCVRGHDGIAGAEGTFTTATSMVSP
jgi:hypothetical protein